jgi:hypothetical protein
MLLIDTRRPPPPEPAPERAAWEPNWRLWGWVALTICALVVADAAGGIAAYLLACLAIGFAGRAIDVALPYGSGLRDYRQ